MTALLATGLLGLSPVAIGYHEEPCVNEALIGADSCSFACHRGQYLYMRLQTAVDANGIGSCGGATVGPEHVFIGIRDARSPTPVQFDDSGRCAGNGIYWGQACWAG